jgi:hypothetical protein
MSTTQFAVGDRVEATTRIVRRDGMYELKAGDSATVTRVWQTTPISPQIVGVLLDDGGTMIDLVCCESGPLQKTEAAKAKGEL